MQASTPIHTHTFMQVTTALIYGGIYSFGDGQSSVGDRLGLCSLVAIGNTNLAMAGIGV